MKIVIEYEPIKYFIDGEFNCNAKELLYLIEEIMDSDTRILNEDMENYLIKNNLVTYEGFFKYHAPIENVTENFYNKLYSLIYD